MVGACGVVAGAFVRVGLIQPRGQTHDEDVGRAAKNQAERGEKQQFNGFKREH